MTPHSSLQETRARIRLLTSLHLADDPTAAVFEGLDGRPADQQAQIILRRLTFLESVGMISCILASAGEVVNHPRLPDDVKDAILTTIGLAALDEEERQREV